MGRVVRAMLAAAFLASTSACVAYQNVGVESHPAGAAVFLDGDPVGRTPVQLVLSRDVEHSVFVKKGGYRPELVIVLLNRNDTPPVFLTPADVRVRLEPLDPGHPDQDRDLEIDVER